MVEVKRFNKMNNMLIIFPAESMRVMRMESNNNDQKSDNSGDQSQYLCFQEDSQHEHNNDVHSSSMDISVNQPSQNHSNQEQYQPRENKKSQSTYKEKVQILHSKQAEQSQHQIQTVRYLPQKDEAIKDYDQKAVIARYFCKNKGLDYDNMMRHFLKYKVNYCMNKDRYRRLLYSFINDVVRALERYIVHQLNQDVEQFRRRELRDSLPFLLRCRSNFSSYICQIFTNFAKFVFQLQDVELQPTSLIFLHSKIGELISNLTEKTYKTKMYKKINKEYQSIPLQNKNRRKPGPRKPTSMDQINKIWNGQHEKIMIEKYKDTHSFRMIRQYFCHVFYEHRFVWTRQNIGRQFQKVLRRGLTKLKTMIEYLINVQKVSIPGLINLDHRMIKILVRRPSFINIRLMFIDLLQGKKDLEFITELISTVNEQMGIVRDRYEVSNEHANIGKQLEYFRQIQKIRL